MSPDAVLEIALLAGEHVDRAPRAADEELLQLFDRWAPSLLRYVSSFGLDAPEAEDVVQDVFLALFRHLRLERSRRNLPGWLFQVAHNLALRQRRRLQRRPSTRWDETLRPPIDPAPDPEARLAQRQRERRLTPVLRALPARDRRCLRLRAEGLRYREIAETMGMSLGGVAKSLARSLARLVHADQGMGG